MFGKTKYSHHRSPRNARLGRLFQPLCFNYQMSFKSIIDSVRMNEWLLALAENVPNLLRKHHTNHIQKNLNIITWTNVSEYIWYWSVLRLKKYIFQLCIKCFSWEFIDFVVLYTRIYTSSYRYVLWPLKLWFCFLEKNNNINKN